MKTKFDPDFCVRLKTKGRKNVLKAWHCAYRAGESRAKGPKQQGSFVRCSSPTWLYVGHFISILVCVVVVWDNRGLPACLSLICAEETDKLRLNTHSESQNVPSNHPIFPGQDSQCLKWYTISSYLSSTPCTTFSFSVCMFSLYFSLSSVRVQQVENKSLFNQKNSVIETECVTGHLLCLLYQKHPLGQSQWIVCV